MKITLKRPSSKGGEPRKPFTLLPEGRYLVSILDVEPVDDKYGGLRATVSVLEGEYEGTQKNFRLFPGSKSLTTLLEVAGYDTEEEDSVDVDLAELTLPNVFCYVGTRESGGKTYNTAVRWAPYKKSKTER